MKCSNIDLSEYDKYLKPLFSHPDSEAIQEKLCSFFVMLLEKALPFGFIGKADEQTLFERHILDSLLPLNDSQVVAALSNAARIADLGSGAGLPAIPLSVFFPKTLFSLHDSAGQRCEFLRNSVKNLSLPNVSIAQGNITREAAEPADIVTFRAFRKPLASLEYAAYFLSRGGKALYWRSRELEFNSAENLSVLARERLTQLGFDAFKFIQLDAPESLGKRGVYLFDRESEGDSPFPRSGKKILADSLVNEFI